MADKSDSFDDQTGGALPDRLLARGASDSYEIDVVAEDLMTVGRELPAFVRRLVGGRRIHKSTACRWALQGLRGLRLPTVRIGGRLYTSAGAFSWWANRLAEKSIAEADEALSSERRREDVSAVLRRAGIE